MTVDAMHAIMNEIFEVLQQELGENTLLDEVRSLEPYGRTAKFLRFRISYWSEDNRFYQGLPFKVSQNGKISVDNSSPVPLHELRLVIEFTRFKFGLVDGPSGLAGEPNSTIWKWIRENR